MNKDTRMPDNTKELYDDLENLMRKHAGIISILVHCGKGGFLVHDTSSLGDSAPAQQFARVCFPKGWPPCG